ncbi:glc operon protein GlcG [Variovorax boronicumulans]|uniref:GlcG/HbpS family heme-binding protein n=1 Tax=Variovorax boronicumulans TaxID=436515 RepID=UPI002786B2B8|nr:heme-binding protein [Variovorax boronicumulans]MDQ0073295.1 glc operon protein GlcG [Variovorax boronicumulans]
MFELPQHGQRLTSLHAQELALQALATGRTRQLRVAAAVVDAGGHLLAFIRDDNAFLGSIDAAVAKARTAVYFRRETAAMQQGLEQGKTAYLALTDALPLEGGVPLYLNGEVVGAVGISGAASTQDGELARAVAADLGFAQERQGQA